MENKNCVNRKSPRNEDEYIKRYLEKNPSAKRKDGMDVSAVRSVNGINGHGLLPEEFNRSHDNKVHRVYDFIPDSELKK